MGMNQIGLEPAQKLMQFRQGPAVPPAAHVDGIIRQLQ